MCVYLCFIVYKYADICVYRYILACIWSHPSYYENVVNLGSEPYYNTRYMSITEPDA